ncbi:MAG: hypothetical protein J3Q66DRAFT_340894 [Benniella sp.]|nr:MAG: hypothetical protein J3Q66DRAFT_340894 [Benniella sp.]
MPPISELTLRPSLVILYNSRPVCIGNYSCQDGSWIWRLQLSIPANWIKMDSMEVCKITYKPIDIATFAFIFSTSLDTTIGNYSSQGWIMDLETAAVNRSQGYQFLQEEGVQASEPRHAKDGSWIWRIATVNRNQVDQLVEDRCEMSLISQLTLPPLLAFFYISRHYCIGN